MTTKPVLPREKAAHDIDAAIDFYLAQDAKEAALAFLHELEQAFDHISQFAATGSPRYAHELNLPGLRRWRLSLLPFLVFYIEHETQIDVWRVLHTRRDLPGWLQDEEDA